MASTDLRIIAGTTFGFGLSWTTRDTAGLETPVDLTGCSAAFQIRADGGDLLLGLSTATTGVSLTDPLAGTLTVTIAPGDTAGQVWKQGSYAIEVTFPSGAVHELARGRALLIPEIVQ